MTYRQDDGVSEKRFEQKIAKGEGEEHGDGAPWLQNAGL